MPVPNKRRVRGKRARRHWQQRRGRDLREHYRAGDSAAPDLQIVEFDDAFGSLDPQAQLRQAVHPDGGVGGGAPEWRVPPKPKVRAIARLKQDPLGKLFHRHQLEQSSFAAGREYQQLHIMTRVGSVQSLDWSKTRVSGASFDPLPESRRRAAQKLRYAEDALAHRYGNEGLALTHDILCECVSIDRSARLRGARSVREVQWFGSLFRRCLRLLAIQGFASAMRTPPRLHPFNGDGGIPDTTDASMHAGADELVDPGLRRGHRPNGKGHA